MNKKQRQQQKKGGAAPPPNAPTPPPPTTELEPELPVEADAQGEDEHETPVLYTDVKKSFFPPNAMNNILVDSQTFHNISTYEA